MLSTLSGKTRRKVPVSTVDISRDGSRYLWGGGTVQPESYNPISERWIAVECVVNVYDISSNRLLHTLDAHQKPVVKARFLDDDSVLSLSFDSHVCFWTATGELAFYSERISEHRTDAFSISPDGNIVVIGDYVGQMAILRRGDGFKPSPLIGNIDGREQVASLALHADGNQLLSGSSGGKIGFWNLDEERNKKELSLGKGFHVNGLAWHPDGKHFLTVCAPDGLAPKGSKSRVMVYDSQSCNEVVSFYPDGHQPLCCAWSPDGRLVAAAGGSTDRDARESRRNCVIHIWEFDSGASFAKLVGHSGLVRDLAFSPDSNWLLSAGWDDTVRCWSLLDENQI